jgi:integrase
MSPGTKRTYASAWRRYAVWCADLDLDPFAGDPGLVALYLADRAGDLERDPESGLAISSLGVARAAISAQYRLRGVPINLDDERIGLVMAGATNIKGKRPRHQAAAAVLPILRRLLAAITETGTPAAPVLAARNRALLLLGFGAALRRAELTALTIGDVAIVPGAGVQLLLRRAKSDQQGKGKMIGICANPADPQCCPQAALEAWLAIRRLAPDIIPPVEVEASERKAWVGRRPLFVGIGKSGRLKTTSLVDRAVARVVKQAALLAGLDAAGFSGHSLRRGFLTDAGRRKLYLADIMRHSRHVKVETLLGYMEATEIWLDNVTNGAFGLPLEQPE